MNSVQPKVAVIVRTKNRTAFLGRALLSITRQTFAEWEVVIINDGGPPQPVDEAIERLSATHRSRITVLHSPQSRGRWVSANSGVLATSAPLVVLHDDDDTWHPTFLDRAVSYLDSRPEHAGVVSRIEIVWEEQQGAGPSAAAVLRDFAGYTEVGREIFQPSLHAPTLGDTMLFNRFVPIGFVYRRRLHEELGLYDERLPVVGDWQFNLRVLSKAPLEYLDSEPLAFWHQRTGTSGAAGNSVISSSREHEKHDALIRDEALRKYVAEHGDGLVLYLTKFIDQRLCEVESGLRGEITEVRKDYRKLNPVYRLLNPVVQALRRR